MKKIIIKQIVFLFTFGVSSIAIGQSQQQQLLNKYWHYRYRLVHYFESVGPYNGQSIPADCRNEYNGTILSWNESVVSLGYYIGVLATEYALLKANGQPLNETIDELFWAENAVWRLNLNGEEAYGQPATTFPGTGFMIRDDISNNFLPSGHPQLENYGNLSSSPPYIVTGNGTVGYINTPASDYISNLGQSASSQDLYYAMLMGLDLAYQLTDDNLSFDGGPYQAWYPVNLSSNAHDLAKQILNYMIFTDNFELKDAGNTAISQASGGDCSAYETPLVDLGNYFGLNTSNICGVSNFDCNSTIWSNALTLLGSGDNTKMTLELAAMTNDYGGNSTSTLYLVQNLDNGYNAYDWDLFYSAILGILHPTVYNYGNFSWDNTRAVASLADAPTDGPFQHSGSDLASAGDWAASRRFYDAKPTQNQGNWLTGNYNGLDYMLFYNLYYLVNKEILNPAALIPYTNVNVSYAMEYPNINGGVYPNALTIQNYCSQIVINQLWVHGYNNNDGALEIQGGPDGVLFHPQATAYTANPLYSPFFPIEDLVESDYPRANDGGYLHVTSNSQCNEPWVPSITSYTLQPDDPNAWTDGNDRSPDKHNNDSTGIMPTYKMTSEFDSVNNDYIITYPNPFQTQITIEFAVKQAGKVFISISNIQGARVVAIIDGEEYTKGSYTIKYDGSSLTAGTYYCTLQTTDYNKTCKIVKVK